MTTGLIIILSSVSSLASVWAFRSLAAGSSRLLDIPNERSSHTEPVTRGAGVSIVLTVIGFYILLFGAKADLAFVLSATAIALISFVDDLISVPILLRLTVHTLAASVFVYSSGSYGEISVPWAAATLSFGSLAPVISVIFIVWTINAFNFMDGVDGIAAVQGIGVSLGWLLLGVSVGVPSFSTLGAILLGTCIGFLIFNWQPAKVFMGDVGSTFLGFSFAVFPLVGTEEITPLPIAPLTAAVILLWLFLFDTLVTRMRHIVQLRPFWRAHRDHLYQRIVAGGTSHRVVAAFFGLCAILTAATLYLLPIVGPLPMIAVLVLSPIALTVWGKKRD